MINPTLTNEQARNFMLLKHGLIGAYKFTKKQGVLDYVGQAGCIQFDPIDVCGKNAELVLHSRVDGFTKQMLYDLLYTDRELIDYFDKNLAIMKASDWKYFSRYRAEHTEGGRSRNEINAVCGEIKLMIRNIGAVSSADLDFNESVHWYWSDTKLSRAALETLYFRGELVVHHKKGAIKYYDLAENCIPQYILTEPDPNPGEFDYQKWHVLRRIASVGLLWNRASDAWLNIPYLLAARRNGIFAALLNDGLICEISVLGIKDALYCLASDTELIETVLRIPEFKPRCEFLAPLDNLLWDRKLIKALFGFDYKWEIYTPAANRKYGYYVLPILYGNRFVGRIEAVSDKKSKCLTVKDIWLEQGIEKTKAFERALGQRLKKFAAFNGCDCVNQKALWPQ